MNIAYRLIWNELSNTWVAVAENVKSRGKRASGAVLLAASGFAFAAPPASTELPTGGQVVAGSAGIAQSGAAMNITQTTQRAAIDWQTFNIGSAAQVNFNQPSANSVALNRVLDSNPSQIFGSMTANGQVFLTNPNGVYFSPSASVDVGGLVATTHGISLADFMSGNFSFSRNGATGSVVNEGNLTASLGGYIALLAPEVRNQGVVVAQLGTVALAAGEAYTLQFAGGQLAGVQVEPSTINALVENGSAVQAPGGLIILSALAASTLQGGVVNNSGELTASSLTEKGGVIRLEGDDITLAAGSKLDASGATGGGSVLVGGDWQGSGNMHQATKVTMAQDASIDASATQNGDGGKVVLWSDVHNANSQTRAYGTILAQGGANGGNGGRIETSGHWLDVTGINASASAANGVSGLWLLDPINVTITAAPDAGGALATGTWTPGATGSNISNATIQAALNAGTSVTITTGTTLTEAGNITVEANIAKTEGTASSLTLQADGGIFVKAGATITDTVANALSLNLQATGPIRFADNAVTTNSVNIHGALYMGGKTGGTTNATGNATYGEGIYVGVNTALSAASMILRGQGVLGTNGGTGAAGSAGGVGVKLGTAASLTTTGALAVTGIGGQGGAGGVGSNGSNGSPGTAGGVGGAGAIGGDGIQLADSVNISGDTLVVSGTGGQGGIGGAGGNGGNATGYDTGGAAGGAGGEGAAGGVGVKLGASMLAASNGLMQTATGGKGGNGGRGGNGGSGSNADVIYNAGGGGNGGRGGNSGISGQGASLANGATVAPVPEILCWIAHMALPVRRGPVVPAVAVVMDAVLSRAAAPAAAAAETVRGGRILQLSAQQAPAISARSMAAHPPPTSASSTT